MIRIGLGYDSHRFDPTRPLMLGGVEIADAPGLSGHSDGDAVLHAVIDALLGAAGAGDIGERFPSSDPDLAGAASDGLLEEVVDDVIDPAWRIVNCDITVLAEEPILSAWKLPMRTRIADLLGIDAGSVSVKAKTNEGMGAIGRGEGIAVMAVVLIAAEPAPDATLDGRD